MNTMLALNPYHSTLLLFSASALLVMMFLAQPPAVLQALLQLFLLMRFA